MTTINQPITSKYKDVLHAVRESVRLGEEHSQAVNEAMTEYKYKFESDEDEQILYSWFLGSFGKVA